MSKTIAREHPTALYLQENGGIKWFNCSSGKLGDKIHKHRKVIIAGSPFILLDGF